MVNFVGYPMSPISPYFRGEPIDLGPRDGDNEELLQLALDAADAIDLLIEEGQVEEAVGRIRELPIDQFACLGEWAHVTAVTSCQVGLRPITLLLIERMDAEQIGLRCIDGSTCLHWAAMLGDAVVVQAILQKMTPAQVLIQNDEGETALHIAAGDRREMMAHTLIPRIFGAAQVEEIHLGEQEQMHMYFALISGNPAESLSLLVELDLRQCSIIDYSDSSFLFNEDKNGKESIVEDLLSKMKGGKDLLTDYGMSALDMALAVGNRAIVEMLC